MKKTLKIILVISLLLMLCSCGGNVANVKVVPVQSNIYTDEDINSAIKTVLRYFRSEFSGCTLKEIQYIGDEYAEDFSEWVKQYKEHEAIVLISTFDVDSSGGDGSFEPNSTYSNWNWILVRNRNGSWRHVDHGYG